MGLYSPLLLRSFSWDSMPPPMPPKPPTPRNKALFTLSLTKTLLRPQGLVGYLLGFWGPKPSILMGAVHLKELWGPRHREQSTFGQSGAGPEIFQLSVICQVFKTIWCLGSQFHLTSYTGHFGRILHSYDYDIWVFRSAMDMKPTQDFCNLFCNSF